MQGFCVTDLGKVYAPAFRAEFYFCLSQMQLSCLSESGMKNKDKVKELLIEELIICGSTHENAPPGKDCGEECGVSFEAQIAASNPIISPMRSGGAKHKRCMDCWGEYVDDLINRIEQKVEKV